MPPSLRPSGSFEPQRVSDDNELNNNRAVPDARTRKNGALVDPEMSPLQDDALSSSMTPASVNGIHDSPLSRAGLLQPRSYAATPNFSQTYPYVPRTQDDIRANTMALSNMLFSTSSARELPGPTSSSRDDFIFPAGSHHDNGFGAMSSSLHSSLYSGNDLTASTITNHSGNTIDTSFTAGAAEAGTSSKATTRRPPPSGLSIALARQKDHEEASSGGSSSDPTPTAEVPPTVLPVISENVGARNMAAVYDGLLGASDPPPNGQNADDERSPLLAKNPPTYTAQALPLPISHQETSKQKHKHNFNEVSLRVKKVATLGTIAYVAKTSLTSIPAVVLGTLLNILDGVSYGMIIFPAAGVFENLGGMGVSMFFVSAFIAQLCYTFGGSGFAGANGSMMIEVVVCMIYFSFAIRNLTRPLLQPFFHIIANIIAAEHVLSVGSAFFLLGALKLGALIGFFPRHILVGCIGGVGAFLIETGLAVSIGMSDDDFAYDLTTLRHFFQPHNLMLWVPALVLAILLRVITHKYHHQLIFPIYFLVIPIIFYIVVAAAGLDLDTLRKTGWLFNMGDSGDEKWYDFYSYYDIGLIHGSAIWATIPTQLALLFFNILHPPLNVPALAVSLNEDVDTNKELVAHGYSNFVSGCLGTVPNYLVYVNTLLFYRVGGTTRIAGFLLAVATAILLLIGTGPIAYIPVMVVGALIFVLGIDLVIEALWDTRHRVSRSEYMTIFSIVVVMTIWDFVIGVLFGIVISCFFFVVQNSQRRSVRSMYTGDTAMSAVRRPGAHRAYLREVSRQTMIIRLQGFLFFGTITHVEETIRGIVEDVAWHSHPIRFLVVDLSAVAGVDMSSAEAFVRLQRLLVAKNVVLVFCGFTVDSAVGRALQSVGVLEQDSVELFSTFNDAMEWTENAYLRAWFKTQKAEASALVLPGRQDNDIEFHNSFVGSPRRSQLQDVGVRTMGTDMKSFMAADDTSEPYNTLVRAFSSYGDVTRDKIRPIIPYLERMSAPEGLVLFNQDEEADALYLIESGVLRASYRFAEHTPRIEESMVPGTLAGELSALSGLPRNATVTVERQAVLWKLSTDNMRRLEKENPEMSRLFVQLVLKGKNMLSSLAIGNKAVMPCPTSLTGTPRIIIRDGGHPRDRHREYLPPLYLSQNLLEPKRPPASLLAFLLS
ncbi:hypothetical protein HWV62_12524 [Athelia sp. TMB]|nr:hypothetical protein HWV62_12524 [Athelia sp. TMB]